MKKQFFCLAFLFLISAFLPQRSEAARPNIVLIMADDMGYGDTSANGDSWLKTPNLERLAKQGMRFTDFHSSGPVCSPTRAGLLTGRYQQRAGLAEVVFADPKQNRHHGLHEQEITFSEILKNADYQTAIFGKWHLGYQKKFNPIHHKFDQFRGYVSGNVCFIAHCDRMGIADWWNGLKLEPEAGYTTHLISKHAVNFIKHNKNKPFCLYVAHEAVHSPYQGPNDKPVRGIGVGRLKGNERKDTKQAYREMMEEMDKGIGEILDTLEEQGIAENTLVIFISDNGATKLGSNGALHGHKGSLWEGGHRVPAIVSWPGKIKPGSVTDVPAISIDLMPTMLDLANVEIPKGHTLDGVSLAPVLLKGNQLDKRHIYWGYRDRSAVRHGNWKLLVGEKGQGSKIGLYNLADDLGEMHNLAKQHPRKVKQLQAALDAWKKEVATGATQQPEKE